MCPAYHHGDPTYPGPADRQDTVELPFFMASERSRNVTQSDVVRREFLGNSVQNMQRQPRRYVTRHVAPAVGTDTGLRHSISTHCP